ncbi:MAG: FtsX-like permease family protein [Paenibacillus sp.]|nr:FtsX-like permease family protein [Paenibacillus sp.]
MSINGEIIRTRARRYKKRFIHLCMSITIAGGLVIPATLAQADSAPAEEEQIAAPSVRFSLPEPTGPYTIGTTALHLIDRGRPDPWMGGKTRELMVSIWYPARQTIGRLALYMEPGAAARFDQTTIPTLGLKPGQIDWAGINTHGLVGAPAANRHGSYPVLLYSPGGGVSRTAGTVLAEELASRGYVVLTVDHTHDSSEVEFPDGRVEIQALPKISKETIQKVFEVRELDIRFVLDQLAVLKTGGNPDSGQRRLPRGLADAMDLSNIGIFGHSAGGASALQTMYDDRRIDAGILMDGTLGYLPDYLLPVARHGLDRPFMLIGSGYYKDEGPDSHLTRPDWKSLWEHSTGWKLDLNVPHGMHFTLTDYQAILPQLKEKLELPDKMVEGSIGTVDPTRSIATQSAYIAAFFDRHLRHMSGELLEGPSPEFPDIEFIN